MPLVMAHHDINHLIERCKAGETLKNIADSIGACDRTVMEAFHRVGFRPLQWARDQAIQSCQPLHAAHMAGESLLSISQRTGIGRSTIIRAFKRLGLPWRDRSDGQRARMARLDADARRAHVAGANAAARVREIPIGEKIKRAATRSRRVGAHERELIEELARVGVNAEHQFPIGPYNVDLWVNEGRVAVEIYGAHPSRALMSTRIHKRTEYILDAGHNQLTVQLSHPRGKSFDLAAVCDKVIAFAEFCSRHHPAGGQHGVIRGNGEFVARSSHETHGRPLVVGLDAR